MELELATKLATDFIDDDGLREEEEEDPAPAPDGEDGIFAPETTEEYLFGDEGAA